MRGSQSMSTSGLIALRQCTIVVSRVGASLCEALDPLGG